MKEVKTSIDALEVGMFVSRLDKPWIDTPFDLEGLRIKSKEDIEILRRYTSFVFVNTEEGPAPDPKHWISITPQELKLASEDDEVVIEFKKQKKNEYTELKKAFYEIETSFDEELSHAQTVKKRIDRDFKKILGDLSKGQDLDVKSLKEGIQATVSSIIRNPHAFALLVQLEKANEYAYSHALSCSIWCANFGRHLGLERKDIEDLALGGMLLDLGKIQLPAELLNKTEAITPKESILIRKHVDYSVRMLAKTDGISTNVLRMVATHHERANGKGYPQGLENKDVPIFGRIAGVVDSYDAMTTPRPYSSKTYSPNEAINELYKVRDHGFQAELVEQFIQTVGLYPTGSLVELNNGAVGIVLEVNDLKRLYPSVMLVLDTDKMPLEEFNAINLSEDKDHALMVKKALPTGAYGINIEELFI